MDQQQRDRIEEPSTKRTVCSPIDRVLSPCLVSKGHLYPPAVIHINLSSISTKGIHVQHNMGSCYNNHNGKVMNVVKLGKKEIVPVTVAMHDLHVQQNVVRGPRC